jgi:ribonuclease BN (tRNA processing enzyme)
MELIVLGAGPAYTDRQGASGSAYLVVAGTTQLLLDLGQGSFPRLFPEVRPEDLDAVAITHLHPDHFVDLVSLRHYLRYELQPARRLRVIGPAELGDRLDALHAEPGFSAQALDLEAIDGTALRVGGLDLLPRKVTHTADSHAYRVSAGDGPGLVYSGDCGKADDLAPLIQPGDTLLTEVSFGPGPVPPGAIHLDGPSVGRLASATGVGEILLTHVQMRMDPDETVRSVQGVFDGPVRFVWPGSRATIG